MDISPYISSLLLEHDCVIVPGLGGFVCNYRSSDIHPIRHTISPPSKAISFNKNLKQNDGLLIQHIAENSGIASSAATAMVSDWVNTATGLLKNKEQVVISKVGVLAADIEANIQFFPNEEVNYLKSSFGLRTITVPPVMRGKEIEFTEKFRAETKHIGTARKPWRVAAAIALLVMLGVLAQLMYSGKQIASLNLSESGVFNTVNSIFKIDEPEFNPIPIETVSVSSDEGTEPVLSEESVNVDIEIPEGSTNDTEQVVVPPLNESVSLSESASDEPTYYVMIGAFVEEKNMEAAKQRLQQKYPDSAILIEKGRRLTKFGYSVGHNYQEAVRQLRVAQQEDDSTIWLLRK
jgi:hypothetical protein